MKVGKINERSPDPRALNPKTVVAKLRSIDHTEVFGNWWNWTALEVGLKAEQKMRSS